MNLRRNPVLTNTQFYASPSERKFSFSIGSTINKSIILTLFLLLIAYLSWIRATEILAYCKWAIGISATLAFITAIIIRYKKNWASFLSFLYIFFKGVFLGLLSVQLENRFQGIVLQAVLLCILVFLSMFILYKFKIIVVTKQLRSVIYTATTAIILVYLVSFVLRLFDFPPIPYIHESGPIGILFSLFVSLTAAFHLVLDFEFMERAANRKFPIHMEWYAAFGLMVSIVWQYVSLLRLLKKVRTYK